ncbi:MAG: amidohydrolase [Acidobacteriota bacterium]|nr:amidohydrolase [Acidobacteriota bacterium]
MCRFTIALIACSIPFCVSLHAADADLILHNGKIVTVDRAFSIQQAIAVKAGRITAIGASSSILAAERGRSTTVIDLKGRTVLPGLFDSHVHAIEAGLSEFRAPLPALHSFSDVQAFIRARMLVTPKGQWIVVPRTFPTRLAELRMPTRDVLDVATEHPVMYDASYVVIANSYALKISGITRSTPNPPGVEIVHDDRGEPNGILRNGQSLLKGLKIETGFSDREKLQALEDMLKRYLAAGITSIGDRALTPDQIAIYQKLYAEHRLPLRVAMTWRPDVLRPESELIEEIRSTSYKTGDGDHWLRFAGFKVNYDGGMTIGTAFQREAYGPFGKQLYGMTDPQDRGKLFASPAKLLAIMRAARDKGWQLCAHTQGGGAVDAFLDTMETLNRDQAIGPTRSHLIHASFQSPEAIARAKRLGILADVQAPWLYLDGPALRKVFGYDGLRMFYPLRSYIDAGVIVAGGSDHMIGHDKNRATNPYNPFLNMWVAVSRKTSQGDVLHPEQKITREEALKMHTIWAAYLQSEENVKGSLEQGKLADMTVIDRDFLTCAEDQIKDITPVMTIVEGKVAYRTN